MSVSALTNLYPRAYDHSIGFPRLDAMNTATAFPSADAMASQFSDALQTVPAGKVQSMEQILDERAAVGSRGGVDRHRSAYAGLLEQECVCLQRGVWLIFGGGRVDAPYVAWRRERGATTFGLLTRGVGMVTTASTPHLRGVFSEGQVVATSCSDDTPVWRHLPPGVYFQSVSLAFQDDQALAEFGLDPNDVHEWSTAPSDSTRRSRAFRAAAGTPTSAAQKAARDILWSPFSGSRRRLYLRSKAGELMCHILGTPASSFVGADIMPTCPRTDDSLAVIAHSFLSEPKDCPDIPDLAMKLQVSSGRLIAAFRARYGISPREHLNSARMSRAKCLLEQTQDSVIDVALDCGYSHHSSFSTAYRRAFGESPIETRRAYQAKITGS